ncbi:MAG: DUF5713 family protein [Pseudoxanthomonas sp.]
MRGYPFLAELYDDDYYPKGLLDRASGILLALCRRIEAERPASLKQLYRLTHAATEEFNVLAKVFEAHDSQIETVARDCIGMDFAAIAKAYGFAKADVEELIAPRDW